MFAERRDHTFLHNWISIFNHSCRPLVTIRIMLIFFHLQSISPGMKISPSRGKKLLLVFLQVILTGLRANRAGSLSLSSSASNPGRAGRHEAALKGMREGFQQGVYSQHERHFKPISDVKDEAHIHPDPS